MVDAGAATRDDARRRNRRFWFGLVALTLAGLALRAGYVTAERWDYAPQGDAFYYHATANQVADGEGIINPFLFIADGTRLPAADHPPLYTIYLAAFSAIGLDTPNAHMLASAVLGAVTVLVAGLAGRSMVRAAAALRRGTNGQTEAHPDARADARADRVGLTTAALVALYTNLWRHDGMLMSETVAVACTALAILFAYQFLERPSAVRLGLVGGAVGLATLARSELVLLALFLVVPLVLVRHGDTWATGMRWLAVSALACIVVVAPWIVRNWQQLDRPMLSNQLEVTLALANCDSTYYGELIGYWDFACGVPALDAAGVKGPADPRFTEVLGEEAFRYTGDHASRVPTVVAARIGRTLTVYRPAQQVEIDRDLEGNPGWVATLGLWTFRLFAIGAIAGGILLRRRRVPLFPLIAPIAAVLVTVVALYSSTRFRAPADLSLAMLSAGLALALPPERNWKI